MPEELQQLAARLDALADDVAELRRRVAELEIGGVEPAASFESPGGMPGVAGLVTDVQDAGRGSVALVGRTLVVLGGAYLLRAISDSGLIPNPAGVAAGLAYAVWWLVACHRAAERDRLSALFHGLAASIIAFPLVFEATARFGVLSPTLAATVLVGLLAAGLWVAMKHDMPALGWTITLLMTVTALALVLTTHDLVPLAFALLLAAAGLESVAIDSPWRGLRWPVAAVLDLVAILLAFVVAREGGLPAGYAPIAVSVAVSLELLLAVLYLSSIAARTLVFRRRVTVPGMAQCTAALIIGLGGASGILTASGSDATPLSVIRLLLGAGCYAVSFAWLDRRLDRGRNFYFYATLALLLMLTGSFGLLRGQTLATLWIAMAIIVSWLGRQLDRSALSSQGSAYWLAGCLVAGVFGVATHGLIGSPLETWSEPTAAVWLAIAAGGVCYVWLLPQPLTRSVPWPALAQRTLLLVATAWGIAGLAGQLLSRTFAGAGSAAADEGLTATLRTSVLAVAAVVMAATSRRWKPQELSWLVNAILLAGGLKLLLEDLSRGRPATLFLSLALYGGALVAVPRLTAAKSK